MNKTSYSSIMLKNVAYKTYLNVAIDDLEMLFQDFLKRCIDRKVELAGDLTYAITRVNNQNRMDIYLLIPVSKGFKPDAALGFRSFFMLNQLLQGRITSENFIEDEIKLLEEMNVFAKENNLTFISPYYHTLKTNFKGTYAWIDVQAKVYEDKSLF
ncbi:DUF5085 family protein [Staphylococcus lutrae]|uniref:DUF5085 domain-containing protein n=1 Tax=Staphylococcus lutrae TaxID=155085 RepID=A0AAC9WJG3_9STAP|nr:DUF5085 family protein [Staphylococcus lutrae]ARJ51003.1 DUF5085 domain-containing protein [Staphylococcus lutrae]PNZ37141.1 DUF5085 domain-containing protein [Staphylococcus lutrae]